MLKRGKKRQGTWCQFKWGQRQEKGGDRAKSRRGQKGSEEAKKTLKGGGKDGKENRIKNRKNGEGSDLGNGQATFQQRRIVKRIKGGRAS